MAPLPVTLLGLATAVPPNLLEQSAIADRARRIYAESFVRYPKLADVFVNAGIGITDNFAELTKPDGYLLWVNGEAVTALSLPSPKDPYVKEVRTVVELGGWNVGIRETIKQATNEINAHRREPL